MNNHEINFNTMYTRLRPILQLITKKIPLYIRVYKIIKMIKYNGGDGIKQNKLHGAMVQFQA